MQLSEALDREARQLLTRSGGDARELKILRSTVKEMTREREEIEHRLRLLEMIRGAVATPPTWLTPKESQRGHRATAYLQLADTHFEEKISPDEIDGLNKYDRRIALMRLHKCFNQFIVVMRDFHKGAAYDGVVVPMTGDMFSGNIHSELKETNESTLFDGLLYWVDPVTAGLRLLADEFGKVHVPCVAGNHGRQTIKPIAKRYAKDNLDWLFYKLLAQQFANDPRVTFQVADGVTAQWSTYGTRFAAEHGNNGFKGGNGISGIFSALMLGLHRMKRKHQAMGQPFDVAILGHFHQFIRMSSAIVGPALKGYDEYASGNKYEPALNHPDSSGQAFWLVTPEHGVTQADVIWTADRRAEGW